MAWAEAVALDVEALAADRNNDVHVKAHIGELVLKSLKMYMANDTFLKCVHMTSLFHISYFSVLQSKIRHDII